MEYYPINEDYEINKNGMIRDCKTKNHKYSSFKNHIITYILYNNPIRLKDIMLSVFKDNKDVMKKEKDFLKDAIELDLTLLKGKIKQENIKKPFNDIIETKKNIIPKIQKININTHPLKKRKYGYDGYNIYGIYNKNKVLIYIGKTEYVLEIRWKQHLYDSKTELRPICEYIRENNECYMTLIEKCNNYFDMNAREKVLIKSLNPICNVVGRR